VALSYTVLHDSEIKETFPTGWAVAATGNMGPLFAVVGEIGGNYKTVSVLGTDVNLRVHSYLGGIRVRNESSNAALFAQLLVGAATKGLSVAGEGANATSFALQPGGGVDFRFTQRIDLRAQFDFRTMRSEGVSTNEFRFSIGAVFGFGGR
jgi:hypothetical protein